MGIGVGRCACLHTLRSSHRQRRWFLLTSSFSPLLPRPSRVSEFASTWRVCRRSIIMPLVPFFTWLFPSAIISASILPSTNTHPLNLLKNSKFLCSANILLPLSLLRTLGTKKSRQAIEVNSLRPLPVTIFSEAILSRDQPWQTRLLSRSTSPRLLGVLIMIEG